MNVCKRTMEDQHVLLTLSKLGREFCTFLNEKIITRAMLQSINGAENDFKAMYHFREVSALVFHCYWKNVILSGYVTTDITVSYCGFSVSFLCDIYGHLRRLTEKSKYFSFIFFSERLRLNLKLFICF